MHHVGKQATSAVLLKNVQITEGMTRVQKDKMKRQEIMKEMTSVQKDKMKRQEIMKMVLILHLLLVLAILTLLSSRTGRIERMSLWLMWILVRSKVRRLFFGYQEETTVTGMWRLKRLQKT